MNSLIGCLGFKDIRGERTAYNRAEVNNFLRIGDVSDAALDL